MAHELASTVARLAGLLASENFPTFERAALKRMVPGQAPPVVFYRLAFHHLPQGWERQEASWQTILAGMAMMAPQIHRPDRPLGQVLAETDYSEARLERLLRAEGEVLSTLFLRLCRFLAAKAQPFNWCEAASLLLVREHDKRERINLKIARDFYRHQKTTET